MVMEMSRICHEKDWAMQLHGGPRRNVNRGKFKDLGRDRGFDVTLTGQELEGIWQLLEQCESE